MNRSYIKYTFLTFALLSVVLSCKITKRYEQPQLNTGDLYRNHQTTDTTTIAAMPWERLFADTILKALIREGLYNNLNLKVAVQKIYEAQAVLGQSKAALFPSLSANANASR
jgi:multidrug efflux system outer membrane protein